MSNVVPERRLSERVRVERGRLGLEGGKEQAGE